MKIDGIGGPRKPGQAPAPEPEKAPRRGRPREAVQADQVEVSEEARRIADLRERAMARPELRQEQIEKLRRVIAEGRHVVDAERLARAILEFEDELLP